MFVHKSPSPPMFDNAFKFCESKDNNIIYSGCGKAKDICIDEYMNAPWMVELVIKIFLLFGFIFIIPLIIYLRKNI